LRDRTAVHALLLLTGVAVGLVALRALRRSQPVGAAVLLLISALVLWWYSVTESVMSELPPVTPHIATLLVLVFATSRLRMPAADGMRYRKGQE